MNLFILTLIFAENTQLSITYLIYDGWGLNRLQSRVSVKEFKTRGKLQFCDFMQAHSYVGGSGGLDPCPIS